jgi:lysophospholipase L1-like esterase
VFLARGSGTNPDGGKVVDSGIMRRLLPALLLGAVLAAGQTTVRREAIEWTDVWMPHTNENNLPRVLLIGDSITRAYYAEVEERLKGKAWVARIATSKALGDPALLAELGAFLSEAKFDVVHFNIGMHGWQYTEEEYRQALPELLRAIRKGAPAAKVVWGQTTPVRADREKGATNGRIEERNRLAREFFASMGVPVDDLHALMKPHADMHTDDVHFGKEGSALLAAQVVHEVEKLLPAR